MTLSLDARTQVLLIDDETGTYVPATPAAVGTLAG